MHIRNFASNLFQRSNDPVNSNSSPSSVFHHRSSIPKSGEYSSTGRIAYNQNKNNG